MENILSKNKNDTSRNDGLDVLRAVAIGLVLLSHGSKFFPASVTKPLFDFFWGLGVMGVELFFALSGFLIGNILLHIQSEGAHFSALGIFMIRRWMRTLPLYYLVLVMLFLIPALDPSYRYDVFSYFTLTQNLFSPMVGIWFGLSWSLAIEEWSYLLLPLIAFGLLRYARQPVATAAILLCMAGIIARMIMGDANYAWDETIRKTVLTRIDAIAYGVVAACLSFYSEKELLNKWVGRLTPVCFALVLSGFIACALRTIDPLFLQGFYGRVFLFTTMGTGFAGLVMLAVEWKINHPWMRPVRFISKISFALYLAHWPLSFNMDFLPPEWRFIGFLAATVAIAMPLSYAIEQPVLRLRPKG